MVLVADGNIDEWPQERRDKFTEGLLAGLSYNYTQAVKDQLERLGITTLDPDELGLTGKEKFYDPDNPGRSLRAPLRNSFISVGDRTGVTADQLIVLEWEHGRMNETHNQSMKIYAEIKLPTSMDVRVLKEKMWYDWPTPEAATAFLSNYTEITILTMPLWYRAMDREEICCVPPSPPPPSPPPSIPPPSDPPSAPPNVAMVVAASVAGGTVGAAAISGIIATLVLGYFARKAEKARRLRARKRMQKTMGGLKVAMKAQSGGKMNVADIVALGKLGGGGASNAGSLLDLAKQKSAEAPEGGGSKIDPGVAAMLSSKNCSSGMGGLAAAAKAGGGGDMGGLAAAAKAGGGGGAAGGATAAAGGGGAGCALCAFGKAGGVKVVDAGVRPSSAAKKLIIPSTMIAPAGGAAAKAAIAAASKDAKKPPGALGRMQTIQRFGMHSQEQFNHFKSFVLRRPPPPKLGSARIGKNMHGGAGKNLLSEKEMARRRKERDKRMAKEKKERERARQEAVKAIYEAPVELDEFGWARTRKNYDATWDVFTPPTTPGTAKRGTTPAHPPSTPAVVLPNGEPLPPGTPTFPRMHSSGNASARPSSRPPPTASSRPPPTATSRACSSVPSTPSVFGGSSRSFSKVHPFDSPGD